MPGNFDSAYARFFWCHDLDVTAKSPAKNARRTISFRVARDRCRAFVLKTGRLTNFRTRFSVGHTDASQGRRIKRRPTVNRPSGLWNRGAVTRLEPATSPEVSIRRRRT